LNSSDVTVVVPMYNAAATIERCISSITAQTAPPAAIIVVDDCSTDGSVELVRGLAVPNLELVIRPANSGAASVPRNEGIARAQTEFVAFLDADDTWQAPFLERVCAAIERFAADFGSAGGVRVNRVGPTRSRLVRSGGSPLMDLTDGFWRVAMRFMPIHTSATVARRSLIQHVGGFPEDVRIGEDLLLFIQLWLNGRFAFVDEALFESVAPPTGLTGSGLRYRDVRLGLARAGRALLVALRRRRRGSGWFALWYARRLVSRHVLYVRRRLARRR
jgi:glycosyltransferase involved in cell wall biosynthesis